MKRFIFLAVLVLSFCVCIFAQTKESGCPTITVTGPESILSPGQNMFFSVSLSKLNEKYLLEYEWTVSAGKIFSGQGTSIIQVLTDGLSGSNIKAIVKVKGLPEKCRNTASEITAVAAIPNIDPLDRYGKIPMKDEFARLDNWIINLINSPKYKGYILFEIEKNEKVSDVKYRLSQVFGHIKKRGVERKWILFEVCKAEFNQTSLLIFSPDAEVPKAEECKHIDISF